MPEENGPGRKDVLGRSRIFTPEVINDIHVKAELGRYRMRGFSIFKPMPHWDELVFLPGTLTRFVIEGYREKCDTTTVLGARFAKNPLELDIPIYITGRVGWSACENMMSGVVVVDGNGGSLTGAAMRGGDLVVKGRVGARTGVDQKGGTILIGGSVGSMTGFMMQRGRQIICGDVGPGLGDSMYDGTIYVAGKVKSLGIDCVPGEWTDADTELIERKFRIYGLGSPPEFQKFVCGKRLYNYDNLEPSERKLVL